MLKIKKFIIVDGNALLHRAWHALPPMSTKSGVMTNAVYGFLTIFFKALKEFKPEYVAVAFDRKEKTFRHEEYKEYKAGREKQPDEFYNQIPIVKEILQEMDVKIFEKVGFEADDIIGTLCENKYVDRDDILSIIVTGDKDALQLVDDNTRVFTLKKGMNDTILYDEKAVIERYSGLRPDQLIDYKGLSGDPSDNIPGVPGVGDKTAIALLTEFETIEKMYEKIEIKVYKSIKVTENLYKKLMDNKDLAYQSKRLGTIIRDVPLELKLDDCLLNQFDKDKIFTIFQKYEFKTLLDRLPDFGVSVGTQDFVALPSEKIIEKHQNAGHNYKLVQTEAEFEKFFKELQKQKIFCFDTETTSLNVFQAKLLGISFCWEDGVAYYVTLNLTKGDVNGWLKKLEPIFMDENIKKVGQNLKYDVKIMKLAGVEVANLYFDTMIASYLLDPGTRSHNLDDMAFRELGYQMTKITDLIGKGKGQITMDFVDSKKVSDYSCEDADYTWRLMPILKKQLEKNDLIYVFEKIEMPLVEVLIEMELNGIKIDVAHLKKLSVKVQKKIDELTKQIHKLAGSKFNISSPKQMKEILFEKLQLSTEGLGKTKTGISTAAGELDKLHDLHPIIPLIEDYRELTKLQSTYIEALPALIEPKTGRVHTDFNQTITATGRLSSSNPNLQNIPIKTELGREIRASFIPEKGFKIVSADYSQVELRVIACLAKDENMMEVFRKGEDIHAATAAKIFNIPLNEVTKDQRSAAKEVNFGVLYGMGAWGLASRKKISRFEAQEFITKYFQSFHKVKDYLDNIREEARKNGYVETIFGRKRYLPEINSGVQQVRAGAERMAINMPIQGTAADLMKIAMIEVHRALHYKEAEGLKILSPNTRMLLQVHDELVFEVPEAEVDKIAKLIDEKMEKIHKLAVPIKVDTEAGDNWQEMEKLY